MTDDPILAIWDRLLSVPAEQLPPAVAAHVLRFHLPDADRDRVEALSRQAANGTLSENERAELDAYTHATAFLTILHSRARVALRSASTVGGNGTPAH